MGTIARQQIAKQGNFRPDKIILGTIARQQIAKQGNFRPEKVILGSFAKKQIARQGNFRPANVAQGLTGFFSPSAQNWDWVQFGEGALLGGFLGGLTSLAVNTVLDATMGKKVELRMFSADDFSKAEFASTLPGRTLQGAVLGGFIGGVVSTTNLACPAQGAESQSLDIFITDGSAGSQSADSPAAKSAPQSGLTTPAAFSTSEIGMLVPSESEAGYQVDLTIPQRIVSDPNMVYYP